MNDVKIKPKLGIGYIIMEKQIIKEYKLEIGKRYKIINQKIYIHDDLSEICKEDLINNDLKFYKVKVFSHESTGIFFIDFKIIKEIDYSILLESNNEREQLLSVVKNHEQRLIDNFIESNDEIKLEAVINSRIQKYLKRIINIPSMTEIVLSKYGRNKHIKQFITFDSMKILYAIINHNRPQDLNYLMKRQNKNIEYFIVINGKRNKDIKNFIKKDNETSDITDTIRYTQNDLCLDYYINSKNDAILESITSVGRKKDLDKLINSKNYFILKYIIYAGFDKHLDVLIRKTKDISLIQEILKYEREGDVEIIKERKRREEWLLI